MILNNDFIVYYESKCNLKSIWAIQNWEHGLVILM